MTGWWVTFSRRFPTPCLRIQKFRSRRDVLFDGASDLLAGVQQLADVEPAACRAVAEVLKQLKLLAGVDQHGREAHIGTMMTELNDTYGLIADSE
jgi:hypothetical protein